MENLILTPVSVDDFAKRVAHFLHDLQKNESPPEPKQEEEYLTSKQVLEIFKISSTTLWKWKKKGRVTEYGTGGKRYFKKSEIDQSLIKTQD